MNYTKFGLEEESHEVTTFSPKHNKFTGIGRLC